MTFAKTITDIVENGITLESSNPPPGGKTRTDPDAWAATLKAELNEAERELARDQKALEAARAKVAALLADVEFDEMKVASRAKGVDTFERLRAKAAK